MPNWINRTTKQVLQSIASADLPEAEANYILDPVLPPPPSRYWNISGDTVSEMSQAEKDVVDAAALEAQRDATANQLDRVEDVLRAFALVVLDEFNTLRAQHGLADRTIAQLKAAIRNKLGT